MSEHNERDDLKQIDRRKMWFFLLCSEVTKHGILSYPSRE
jgi:hypothetical protein